MRPEPSIFDQAPHTEPDADEAALAEAEADMKAGQIVPNAEVSAWLKTWGTAEEGPPPKPWLK